MGIARGREPVPDSTTITTSRKLLNDNKLGEKLFAKVDKELQTRGLKLNTGAIVDVTIIGAPSSTKNAYKARAAPSWPIPLNCAANAPSWGYSSDGPTGLSASHQGLSFVNQVALSSFWR